MDNTEILKQILRKPLESDDILTERLSQILKGLFDAGKRQGAEYGFLKGYDEGYEDGREDEQGVSKKGGQ